MRTIKFRAWEKEERKMYYDVQDAYDYLGKVPATTFGEIVSQPERWEVMQFIGFLDGSGNEIYEGDILESLNEVRYKVVWDGKRARWAVENSMGTWALDIFGAGSGIIIGNFYENPELLK